MLKNRTGDSNKSKSYLELAIAQFSKAKLAVIGGFVLCFVGVIAVFAPLISPHNPNQMDVAHREEPPSIKHLLGTDQIGRDVLSRLLFASRVSLSVGIVSAIAAAIFGILLGGTAGLSGGVIDNIIMRVVDVLLCFPFLPVAIVVAGISGPSKANIIFIGAFLSWPQLARIVRAEYLGLREEDYVQAARALGSSHFRIAFRHILPNAIAPIIVWITLNVAQIVMLEAGLSFLGLGVQIPTPSWGNMLTSAQSIRIIGELPWLWVPPGFMIFATVLSINFVGDGLRDALDPTLKR